MEVRALEGFGATHTLQETWTIKPDDFHKKQQIISTR